MAVDSEQMQANDSTLEALNRFKNEIKNLMNGKGNLKKLLEAVDYKYGDENNAMAVLGVADYLLDQGVSIKKGKSYVLECIDAELEKKALQEWKSPQKRKQALILFRKRVLKDQRGKPKGKVETWKLEDISGTTSA